MLMFESSIFSSFIPQLFMLVAYVSCILAPKFSSNEQLQTFATSADKQIVVPLIEKADLPQAVDYLFSDFYIANDSEFDFKTPHFIAVDAIVHPTHCNVTKAYQQSIFSRPPPVFS